MTPVSSFLTSAVITLCLSLCVAPQARAQATPEQKAYAEGQRQKREAAEGKRAAAEQKQRENMERQRQQEEQQRRQNNPNEPDRHQRERQERLNAQREQEWSRARDSINQDRSGANVGTPQSLSGSAAPSRR